MGTIILTEEILEKGKSKNGAWSRAQLKLFGVLEIRKGWKKKIIGLPFPVQSVQSFINLKDKHLEKKHIIPNSKSIADSLLFVDQDFPINEQYKHEEWTDLRVIILQRDNYTCKICGTKSKELHIHHLMYPKDKYVWQIDHKYLLTVCKNCHEAIHDRRI